MFYEYAVDPAVLSSWDRVRYFLDAFGPWKGRFLARYPTKWKVRVIEGLHCADIEKAKIVERLHRLDPCVLSPRRGAYYEPTRSWRENVQRVHEQEPFHAVIVPTDASDVFVAVDDVSDEHPLWRVEPGNDVARDPAALFVH